MKRITYSAAVCALAVGLLSAAPAQAGPVGPAEECEGLGRAIALRVDGRDGPGPVTLRAGRSTEFALDFRPARSHGATQLHLKAEGEFGAFAMTRGAVGAVEAGRRYTVRQRVTPSEGLTGQDLRLRLHITGDENVREACVSLTVRVAAADAR
ncbi:hypothetical protein [Streptomyces sp. NPDC005805]|uniref:hypothetical protein n=1 Tax=Streptomyces sp. NPDC005805 TaxID=3157068 RepID=UPI0033E42842